MPISVHTLHGKARIGYKDKDKRELNDRKMATHRFGEFYKVDENYDSYLRPGDFEATIEGVTHKESKTGKPMIEIILSIGGMGTLKYYLVDDASSEDAKIWTNKRITKFFDSFGLRRGDFNLMNWIGAKSKVRIDKGKERENGKSFFEVKKFFTPRDVHEWRHTENEINEVENELKEETESFTSAYEGSRAEKAYSGDNAGNAGRVENDGSLGLRMPNQKQYIDPRTGEQYSEYTDDIPF